MPLARPAAAGLLAAFLFASAPPPAVAQDGEKEIGKAEIETLLKQHGGMRPASFRDFANAVRDAGPPEALAGSIGRLGQMTLLSNADLVNSTGCSGSTSGSGTRTT